MNYYNSFSEHLKEKFGFKVYKVPVSIGATCPHRVDGKGGCTYCDDMASASPLIDDRLSLSAQIDKGILWAEKKYKARGFIVYFQPFTNTYVPLNYLKKSIETALQIDKVVGIAIGTRPDCVPEETLDLLGEFSKKTYLWIEYGLQSSQYRTLKAIRRGHSLAEFIDAVLRTKRYTGIYVSTHIIIGLPGENREDILETAKIISALPIDGIKIHLLHILKGTEMEKDYYAGKIKILSMDEYVSLAVDVVERLPQHIIIQRITAEAERDRLIAPMWCLKKQEVLHRINEEFQRRKTYQGKKFHLGLSIEEIERRTGEKIQT